MQREGVGVLRLECDSTGRAELNRTRLCWVQWVHWCSSWRRSVVCAKTLPISITPLLSLLHPFLPLCLQSFSFCPSSSVFCSSTKTPSSFLFFFFFLPILLIYRLAETQEPLIESRHVNSLCTALTVPAQRRQTLGGLWWLAHTYTQYCYTNSYPKQRLQCSVLQTEPLLMAESFRLWWQPLLCDYHFPQLLRTHCYQVTGQHHFGVWF